MNVNAFVGFTIENVVFSAKRFVSRLLDVLDEIYAAGSLIVYEIYSTTSIGH